MAISLNSGSNPLHIFYNGNNVSEVLYNGIHVWPDIVPTLGNITLWPAYVYSATAIIHYRPTTDSERFKVDERGSETNFTSRKPLNYENVSLIQLLGSCDPEYGIDLQVKNATTGDVTLTTNICKQTSGSAYTTPVFRVFCNEDDASQYVAPTKGWYMSWDATPTDKQVWSLGISERGVITRIYYENGRTYPISRPGTLIIEYTDNALITTIEIANYSYSENPYKDNNRGGLAVWEYDPYVSADNWVFVKPDNYVDDGDRYFYVNKFPHSSTDTWKYAFDPTKKQAIVNGRTTRNPGWLGSPWFEAVGSQYTSGNYPAPTEFYINDTLVDTANYTSGLKATLAYYDPDTQSWWFDIRADYYQQPYKAGRELTGVYKILYYEASADNRKNRLYVYTT